MIEEARTLDPDKLCTLRDAINDVLAGGGKPPMSKAGFARHLATEGVIAPVAASQVGAAEDDEREPMDFTGKPLSQMIVDGRR